MTPPPQSITPLAAPPRPRRRPLIILRFPFWATLLLAAGVAVRTLCLFDRSFWIDELFTRDIARLPFWRPEALHAVDFQHHSILSFCLHDRGPGPMMYLIEGALARWAEPLGSEFWLRLPGMAAGIAAIVWAWRQGRALTGGATGALMLVLAAALLPAWVDYSTGARGYAWMVLATLVQFDLLHRLTSGVRNRATAADRTFKAASMLSFRRLKGWIGFLTLSLLAMLIHPVHLFVNGSLFAVCLATRWARRPQVENSSVRRYSPAAFYGGLAATLALQVGWVSLWLASLPPRPSGAPDAGGVWATLLLRLRLNWQGEPAVAALVGSAVVLVGAWIVIDQHRSRRRPLLVAAAFVVLGNVTLALLLAAKFTWSQRYFYSASVVAALAAARLAQFAAAWLRRRRLSATRIAAARAAALLAAAVLLWPPAADMASVPLHNWSDAVRWLRRRVAPGDMIVTGVNGDEVIYQAYSLPLRLPPATTRFLDKSGAPQDTGTAVGMAHALAMGRRVWFVTPYWSFGRPTAYWLYLQQKLHKVADIPGRGAIMIAVYDPPASAP